MGDPADVTVVIPTIPPRAETLMRRAMTSVALQTRPPAGGVRVWLDADGEGPAVMRDRALRAGGAEEITTEWVTFLDDDDEILPQHLEIMFRVVEAVEASGGRVQMVYPWPYTIGGTNPHEANFGQPFQLERPVQTTIVVMVRTGLAREIGFRAMGDLDAPGRLYGGEDWDFTQRVATWCLERDVRPGVVHVPVRTWLWHHHGGNTSGLPRNWRQPG